MKTMRLRHQPTFCPNEACQFHAESTRCRFKKKGFYARRHPPLRVQRYQCCACGRNFSSQTFSTTYWFRYTHLLEPLFHRLVGGSCLRQIAREFDVPHSTIQRQTERLGRHCLLFHEMLRPRHAPREPLVLDGFRTFEHSQYYPFDLNLLVGRSHFVYGFNDAELRRSGAMRPAQRAKRGELERRFGRPDPRSTEKQVIELVGRIVPRGAQVTIRSDEHSSYPVGLRALRSRVVNHERTSSRVARNTENPLFPVNLADLLLRHSSANHKRETIAFSKRRQAALYRAAIWTVWRNYVKFTSENRGDPPPAVRLGIIPARLGVTTLIAQRVFPSRVHLSPWLSRCYEGRIPTRRHELIRTHELRFAR